MDEPIEMDEIGRVNERYDDDKDSDYDDFNPSTEETELINDDGDVDDDDDINKSFTKYQVDTLGEIKYDVLEYQLQSLLKHMGYKNDNININADIDKFVHGYGEKDRRKLYYEKNFDEWVPLTKDNGKFYSDQTILRKFGGKELMEEALGIDKKNTKSKSRGAKLLNNIKDELPLTSKIKNADEIELQSMTEKTIESVHTIDTSFVDGGATNQFNEREMKAFDREIKRIDGALKEISNEKIIN